MIHLHRHIYCIFAVLFGLAFFSCSNSERSPEQMRELMVKNQLMQRGIIAPSVLHAFSTVPREQFVLSQYASKAYDDAEAPTGRGQSLDRPYENAIMLDALNLKPEDKVLEVGTGSGYTAALLSRIVNEVFTIEIEPDIADDARKNIAALKITNVQIRTGDGYIGWDENAPFTKILMACSPPKVPAPLVGQLSEGGLLIAPIGGNEKFQVLTLYKKRHGRLVQVKTLSPTAFSPMKGMIRDDKR